MQTGTVNFLLRHLLSSIMRPQRPSLSRHETHSAGDQTHTENLEPEITHRPQNIKHRDFSIDDQSWILLQLSNQSYCQNHFYSCFKSGGHKVQSGFYRWRADRSVFFHLITKKMIKVLMGVLGQSQSDHWNTWVAKHSGFMHQYCLN